MTWTDEHVSILREGVAAGESYSIIARRLPHTRNACLGKAHRLGLVACRAPGGGDGRTARTVLRSERLKPAVHVDLPILLGVPSLNVSFAALGAGMCRWPTGQGGAHLFCGLGCSGVYCEAHKARAHVRSHTTHLKPPMEGDYVRAGSKAADWKGREAA